MRAHLIALAAGLLTVAAGARAQEGPAPTPPPSAPQPAGPAGASGEFANADELLRALEHAGDSITRLRADVNYVKTFNPELGIGGDDQIRVGTLWYVRQPSPDEKPAQRRFSIRFDRKQIGERVTEESEIYIFDGQWLLEKYPDQNPKFFIKRQIAPPGADFDPLRVGEGPITIPIGQKRDDIVARYDVTLLPPADSLDAERDRTLVKQTEGAHQLRLVPRADNPDPGDFKEIRLWYRRDARGELLPVMARTINTGDDQSTVQLINVETDASDPTLDVPAEVLSTATPGKDEGWDGTVMSWKREGADIGDE